MALTEVEFELSAGQFDLMGYPHLRQGQPLVLQLETGVLLPDPAAEAWYAVAKEPMPERFVRVGRAQYAFAGQIEAAETMQHDDVETATLIVRCGEIPLRVYCAPQEDGRLPYGTWETRYLAGYSRIYGLAEEDLSMGPGSQIGATFWSFRRLVLAPGDPLFGEWHESVELLPVPYAYDRICVTARVHRQAI
ncbi:MAG: hypothetical protein QM346_14275 [Chloroflexota bacterium]|jgi:hypothetical protein|nr:hypothetical protein [Chloroflexota bacterium]